MSKVVSVLLLILFSPLLLLAMLCVLICLPFQIFFYKRSAWFADREEKYRFGAEQTLYYKLYNMAKKNEWSLEYREERDYRCFICKSYLLFPLLDHVEELFYNEKTGSWMVFEYEDEDQNQEDALLLEEYLARVRHELAELLEDRALMIVLDESSLGNHIGKGWDYFLVYTDKKDLKQQLQLLLAAEESAEE